jgi:hypothetical protein
VWILFADACHQSFNNFDVPLFQIALVRSHFRGLVNQIETHTTVGNTLVAPDKGLPMEDGGGQRFVAFGLGSAKQIGRLEFPSVDAVSKNAVKIQIDVDLVLAA